MADKARGATQPAARDAVRRALSRPAAEAARAILGFSLCRRLDDGSPLAGRIVETEAYAGREDRASHAFGGRRSARNESMYGPPATAYVYFTYGMHWCCNVVCMPEGEPQAVLIRALEPLVGIEAMRRLRLAAPKPPARLRDRDVCAGPARLCSALAIDRALDGEDLLASPRLWIEPAENPKNVRAGPRVGIARAGEPWVSAPLRFADADSACLSRPASGELVSSERGGASR